MSSYRNELLLLIYLQEF